METIDLTHSLFERAVMENPKENALPQPYQYGYSDNIDPPDPWQYVDMEYLYKQATEDESHGTANWSEMGAKKTSTGLWLIQRIVKEEGIKNPKVLVVTTRSGKGAFYQLAPEILEGWMIFDIGTQGISALQGGKLLKFPPSKLKHLPDEMDFPVLVLTHYQVFSKSTHGEFKVDQKTGMPLKDARGAMQLEDPTQGDRIAKDHLWDFAWLDEAHRIKDKDTKWTISAKRIKGKKRMVSTGTGFINRPYEIWSLLNFIDKKRLASFWNFYEIFCEIDDAEGYSRVVGVKPEMKDEFRKLVRRYGPRRTLSEVMPHIKEPIVPPDVLVNLNDTQRRMYDEIKTHLRTLDQKGVPIHASNVLTLLQRLRMICVATPEVVDDYYDEDLDRRIQRVTVVEPSAKLDAVQEIIEGLEWDEEHKSPIVIFSNFVAPLNLLEARFNKANQATEEMGLAPEFPYLYMKQADSDELRYEKWYKLFPTMEYRIFMSTVQLGGESINLTPSRHVIFLDRSWSPKDNMQAVGRIRRPGQEGQPVVINVSARNTVDQYIHEVNRVKQGWFNQIFSNEEE